MARLFKRALICVLFLIVSIAILVVGLAISAPHFSDGPIGPIPGGVFQSGTLIVKRDIDWSFYRDGEDIEMQLLSPEKSRTTGAFVFEDDLYVSADLGFIWNRFPQGLTRWILQIIYIFKDWHEAALEDGRVVLRMEGNLYERQAVRITDADFVSKLHDYVEAGLPCLDLPANIGERPEQAPNDIWYFRMDPRL